MSRRSRLINVVLSVLIDDSCVSNSLSNVVSSSSMSRSSSSADVFSLFSRSARSSSRLWRLLMAAGLFSSDSSSDSDSSSACMAALNVWSRKCFMFCVILSAWNSMC